MSNDNPQPPVDLPATNKALQDSLKKCEALVVDLRAKLSAAQGRLPYVLRRDRARHY